MRPSGKNLKKKHYVPVNHHWLSVPRPTFSALLKSQGAGRLQTTFHWFSCQLSPRKNLSIGRIQERKQCYFLFKISAFGSASGSNSGSCKFQKRSCRFSAVPTEGCPPGRPRVAVAVSPSDHQQVWPRPEEVPTSWSPSSSSCSPNICVASFLH